MAFLKKIKQLIKPFVPPILTGKLPYYKLKGDILDIFNINIFEYENKSFNRIAFINYAINRYEFEKCKYLEIGVLHKEVFDSIPLLELNKYGVDPVMGGNFKMTSDEFFQNIEKDLKFDVVFIDGLHTYKQCQNDVLNSLNFLNEDGVIFIHDLLPRNHLEGHSKKQATTFWHGEIWKVAVEINDHPDLLLKIANIDKGVGIVKKKKQYSSYKKNDDLKSKSFDDFINIYKNQLDIVDSYKAFEFIKKTPN